MRLGRKKEGNPSTISNEQPVRFRFLPLASALCNVKELPTCENEFKRPSKVIFCYARQAVVYTLKLVSYDEQLRRMRIQVNLSRQR